VRLSRSNASHLRLGGGTAPERVAEQLARLRRILDEQRDRAAQYGGPRRR
jgi:hypothetical protein